MTRGMSRCQIFFGNFKKNFEHWQCFFLCKFEKFLHKAFCEKIAFRSFSYYTINFDKNKN